MAFFIIVYNILQKPIHAYRQEEVVPCVIQMGSVFGSLEILLAELFVAHLNY